ncbi:hypothetical protein GQ43DRAFT_478496 [Delitschia confertaspora ATCC 74209]|uniref:polynucleotide adenylyltransferase n=1 Tax=Delitschia confertaspora ATCC 74209 TaxID=1513339 RepID=A0A9P4JS17_9PLEO|nr:hypothetical protein GQ43DRAFT_478496 [Delitschia confertaspora ATCC 74209]
MADMENNSNPQATMEMKLASPELSDATSLSSLLSAYQMIPSESEEAARREAFSLIEKVLLGSTDEQKTTVSSIPMVVVPVGSYALGVWTEGSNIDCLCIGSISEDTFFKLARQRIRKAAPLGVRLVRKVEAGFGRSLGLSVIGVQINMQYCPASNVVIRWDELPQLASSDPIFNLPVLSLRRLKQFRDVDHISKNVPDPVVFRVAYRCIKLWALRRGIYSSTYGYLNSTHIAIMLFVVCRRIIEVKSATAADIVATFFHHYANFNWANDMVFDELFHGGRPQYQRPISDSMVIIGFYPPHINLAHSVSVSSVGTVITELKLASQTLSIDQMTWSRFFGPLTIHVDEPLLAAGATEFLMSYPSYVQVDMRYWGRTPARGKSLLDWLESRCVSFVDDIYRAIGTMFQVRIWPHRFTPTGALEGDIDYHGYYLIGISRHPHIGIEQGLSREGRQTTKAALQATISRFEDRLFSDTKYQESSSSWIGVNLVGPDEVKSLKLDGKVWGDHIIEEQDDSDDEFDPKLDSSIPTKPTARRSTTPSQAVSGNKLRPASHVLNRLRWDRNLDPSDYIVGYDDRFLGAKEMGLERWKTDQTDEEFIPQHRILYFKKRSDGGVVWERRRRVDLVFGSGASGDSVGG